MRTWKDWRQTAGGAGAARGAGLGQGPPDCPGKRSGSRWPRRWRKRRRSEPAANEDVQWLLDKAGAYVVEDLAPGSDGLPATS